MQIKWDPKLLFCPLHSRLDAAIAMIRDAFTSCTIQDLLAAPPGGAPLCGLGQDSEAASEEPNDVG